MTCDSSNYGEDYEVNETSCSDGLDNDCDIAFDCHDLDCGADPICTTSTTPLLWLEFENNLDDSSNSGNIYNIDWIDGVGVYVNGISNWGIDHDGTDNHSYVLISHHDDLQGMNNLTLAIWVKKNDPYQDNRKIILKHPVYHFSLNTDSISWRFWDTNRDASSFNQFSLNNINDNSWHHYAVTYDASINEVKLYVDGLQVGSTQNFYGFNIGDYESRDVFISKNAFGSGETANVVVDEFRVYDVALTAGEIGDLFNNP